MVKIHQIEILLNIYPQLLFTHRGLESFLNRYIQVEEDINVIFIDKEGIRELNTQYREKEEVTDVLSFNIDEKNILGEVYICPEYISENYKGNLFLEEVLRDIIHGILHLKGLDHTKKFDKLSYKSEDMYIKQEEILNNMLKDLKIDGTN